MIQRRLIYAVYGLLFLLMPLGAQGQAGGFSQANVPTIGSGQMPTAVPRDELSPTNIFQMGIAVGARFDDNALFNSIPRRSDIGYSVTPSVAFVQTLRRVDWGVSYGPGVEISEHRFFTDQFTNDFGGHFTWLLSKHSMFSAQQNYILSTNPFQRFGSQAYTTTPSPIVAPNQSIYLPNLRITSNLSQAQYSYQLGAHTTFGLNGSFDLQQFRSTPSSGASRALINSQSTFGQAYISHQFSPRNQLGFQYVAQILKFQGANARTTIHSFLIFDDVKLTSNSRLSLYGGPEYSLVSNQVTLALGFVTVIIPVKENTWTWSGGGIYSWTGRRAAVVLNYSRRITSGGGVTGAVELNGGSADFRWKLSRSWSTDLNLAAADNQLLVVKTAQNELRTYSASLGLSRQIFKNMSMNFFFERLDQVGSIAGITTGNHDVAGVSLAYNFSKPIGR
jgi:hypothetical protein